MALVWAEEGWRGAVEQRLKLLRRLERVTKLRVEVPLLAEDFTSSFLTEELLSPFAGWLREIQRITELELVVKASGPQLLCMPWSLPALMASLFPAVKDFTLAFPGEVPGSGMRSGSMFCVPAPALFYHGLWGLRDLSALTLHGCSPDAATHLHQLSGISGLSSLLLGFPNHTLLLGATSRAFATLARLTHLELWGCDVGWDQGCALLACLPPQLESLRFKDVAVYSDQPGFAPVEASDSLANYHFDVPACRLQVTCLNPDELAMLLRLFSEPEVVRRLGMATQDASSSTSTSAFGSSLRVLVVDCIRASPIHHSESVLHYLLQATRSGPRVEFGALAAGCLEEIRVAEKLLPVASRCDTLQLYEFYDDAAQESEVWAAAKRLPIPQLRITDNTDDVLTATGLLAAILGDGPRPQQQPPQQQQQQVSPLPMWQQQQHVAVAAGAAAARTLFAPATPPPAPRTETGPGDGAGDDAGDAAGCVPLQAKAACVASSTGAAGAIEDADPNGGAAASGWVHPACSSSSISATASSSGSDSGSGAPAAAMPLQAPGPCSLAAAASSSAHASGGNAGAQVLDGWPALKAIRLDGSACGMTSCEALLALSHVGRLLTIECCSSAVDPDDFRRASAIVALLQKPVQLVYVDDGEADNDNSGDGDGSDDEYTTDDGDDGGDDVSEESLGGHSMDDGFVDGGSDSDDDHLYGDAEELGDDSEGDDGGHYYGQIW